MSKPKAVQDIINHSTGTTQYHRFSNFPHYPIITDGVREIAESAGAYWLLDIVGSYQQDKRLDKAFQVWKLKVNRENHSGVVCGYNDTKLIITQDIPFTTFPLEEFTLYLMNDVILLPTEH